MLLFNTVFFIKPTIFELVLMEEKERQSERRLNPSFDKGTLKYSSFFNSTISS